MLLTGDGAFGDILLALGLGGRRITSLDISMSMDEAVTVTFTELVEDEIVTRVRNVIDREWTTDPRSEREE